VEQIMFLISPNIMIPFFPFFMNFKLLEPGAYAKYPAAYTLSKKGTV